MSVVACINALNHHSVVHFGVLDAVDSSVRMLGEYNISIYKACTLYNVNIIFAPVKRRAQGSAVPRELRQPGPINTPVKVLASSSCLSATTSVCTAASVLSDFGGLYLRACHSPQFSGPLQWLQDSIRASELNLSSLP